MNKNDIDKMLMRMAFQQREEGFSHLEYDEELLQFEYVRAGDPRAEEEAACVFSSSVVGKLSEDPVRDKRYLFVAATTLTTRFAIEGGLDQETAYNLSDLFIRKMDLCQTVSEIKELHREMVREFTRRVAAIHKVNRYSKPIQCALDDIYLHLQEPISVDELAERAGLSRSYFSVLFKKEVGMPVSDYIRNKRIEAAENMLKYSNFSLLEIGSYLAFNSQSHFVSVFKHVTGMTPGAYRRANFRRGWRDSVQKSRVK
ncbi:MAG: helix-turn-helix domain-containing protein [Burkholderiales bacterium]